MIEHMRIFNEQEQRKNDLVGRFLSALDYGFIAPFDLMDGV